MWIERCVLFCLGDQQPNPQRNTSAYMDLYSFKTETFLRNHLHIFVFITQLE